LAPTGPASAVLCCSTSGVDRQPPSRPTFDVHHRPGVALAEMTTDVTGAPSHCVNHAWRCAPKPSRVPLCTPAGTAESTLHWVGGAPRMRWGTSNVEACVHSPATRQTAVAGMTPQHRNQSSPHEAAPTSGVGYRVHSIARPRVKQRSDDVVTADEGPTRACYWCLPKVSHHDLGRANRGPEWWVGYSDRDGHTFVSAALVAKQKRQLSHSALTHMVFFTSPKPCAYEFPRLNINAQVSDLYPA